MQQHIKNLLTYKRKKFLFLALWWIVFITITWGSLSKTPKLPFQAQELSDKGIHFVMYFVFHTSLYYALYFFKAKNKKIIQYTFLFSVLYGGLMELLQYYYIPNRFGEWLDVLANTIGSLLSVTLILIYSYLIEKNKKKIKNFI